MKKVEKLELNLKEFSKNEKFANILGNILKNMKNVQYLKLNLEENYLENEGVENIINGLK